MHTLLRRIPLVFVCVFLAAPVTLAGPLQPDRSTLASRGDDWTTTQIQATGAVQSAAERQRAIDIAARVDGVRRVVDRAQHSRRARGDGHLGTHRARSAQRIPGADEIQRVTQSDPVILPQVNAKFAVDPEVSALGIDVDVEDGIVRLTGGQQRA